MLSSNATLYFLVDYDNVRFRAKNKSFFDHIDEIVRIVDSSLLINFNRAVLRLYGGWFAGQNITKLAQDIFSNISQDFPQPLIILHNGASHKIIVNPELVYGTATEPNFTLFNTYRERVFPTSIRCRHPQDIGCYLPNCSGLPIYQAFRDGKCQNSSCDHSLSSLLYRTEQKLVDTMLAIDLIHFALMGNNIVCLASSDEDFWPSIRAAMFYGTKIYHIHTRNPHKTPRYYYSGYNQMYFEVNL